MFRTPHHLKILLGLAIIAAILSLLLAFFPAFQSETAGKLAYRQALQKKLDNEVLSMKAQNLQVAEFLKEGKIDLRRFTALPLSYPAFVFKGGQLALWNSNDWVPTPAMVKSVIGTRLFSLPQGKFLLHSTLVKNPKDGSSYQLVSVITLFRHYPVENSFLESGPSKFIFGEQQVRIHTHQPPQLPAMGNPDDGSYLFSIDLSEWAPIRPYWLSVAAYCFACIAVLCLLLWIWFSSYPDSGIGRRQGYSGFLLMMALLVTGRFLISLLGYPANLGQSRLFDPSHFAFSSLAPSLGDMLLNVLLALFLLLYWLFRVQHWSFFRLLVPISLIRQWLLALIAGAGLVACLLLVYQQTYQLFHHASWSADVRLAILDRRLTDWMGFGILLLEFVFIFFLYHLFFRILLQAISAIQAIFFLFLITLVAGIWLQSLIWVIVLLLLWLACGAILFFRLPRLLVQMRYPAYLYLFLSAFVFAVISGIALQQDTLSKLNADKIRFGSGLNTDNDVQGEFLLQEAASKIRQDGFIQSTLLSPFGNKELIPEKIRKVYLSNYFERYNIDISSFNSFGSKYQDTIQEHDYLFFKSRYGTPSFATHFKDLYLIPEERRGATKKYICFIDVPALKGVAGYLMIELSQKKVIPYSVYPTLLLDQRYQPSIDIQDYSYSVWRGKDLITTFGRFNYGLQFPIENWIQQKALFNEGLFVEGWHHLAIKGTKGRFIVLSSRLDKVMLYLTSASFVFLLLVAMVLLFISGYLLYHQLRSRQVSYATKIQVYLHISFFIPLFIISITVTSVIGSIYKDNIDEAFIQKAQLVSRQIQELFEQKALISKDEWEAGMTAIGRNTQTDIHFFGTKGWLEYSNQPDIFREGMLARKANPLAWASIAEANSSVYIANERIGELHYKTIYHAIPDAENKAILGMVALPFFESKQELDKQLREVITDILIIFSLAFIVALFISYLASRMLTQPLKLIAGRLRKTSLSEMNDPIIWTGQDEIGMLVQEYNGMLVKLEESKLALARSEKETAWREIAKQVAHEIKNPLTPMRLSLQHLLRKVRQEGAADQEQVERVAEALLVQVDNLNAIASSFSSFAQMPVPERRPFTLNPILEKVMDLYRHQANALDLQIEIPAEPVEVLGDSGLMVNILNNLVLNGIQAVAPGITPQIRIKVEVEAERIIIAIQDNGTGIAEEIKDKIYLPHFSTKVTGSGIGLALAKRVVEYAQGAIWFDSGNSGTTFYLQLPRT